MKKANFKSNHIESDMLIENPIAAIPFTPSLDASATEIEDLEGYVPFDYSQASTETSIDVSKKEANESSLSDEGFYENIELDQTQLKALDALFASYPELLKTVEASGDLNEVIIGVDNRTKVGNTTIFPWRCICSLKITAQNGSSWIGTGWLVGPRTVITAGHCVYMHDQQGWARSIEVIPGLNGASRPYGSAFGQTFKSVTGWTSSKNRDYDYGAIILPANARLGDRTGYFGYSVKDDNYLRNSLLNLSGYPGDKNNGNDQYFMSLKPKSVSSRVLTYDIDTMGGQSGAPVWIKIDENRYCVGIHTNGHSSGNSATRITQEVFNNIKNWKALGM